MRFIEKFETIRRGTLEFILENHERFRKIAVTKIQCEITNEYSLRKK